MTEHSPIILIGAARSGTKFIRDLLAHDAKIAKVPYDINYIWRTGQLSLDHDALDPASLTPRRIKAIRTAIEQLAKRQGKSNPVILEKTVSNCLRIPFVDTVYPQARFVHLVRDGRAVIESSHRLWLAPPDGRGLFRKAVEMPPKQWGYLFWFAKNYLKGRLKGRSGGEIWGPRYPGIVEDVQGKPLMKVVIRQWAECVSRASADLSRLNPSRVLTIRYEDLMFSQSALTKLCDFAEVENPAVILEEFTRVAEPENVEKWRSKLSSDLQREVTETVGPILRQFGYSED